MRRRRRADEGDEHSAPATESIDEALARLARQDTRLNPIAPPEASRRALGPSRVTRDRLLGVLRWVLVVGVAWLIWRFALR